MISIIKGPLTWPGRDTARSVQYRKYVVFIIYAKPNRIFVRKNKSGLASRVTNDKRRACSYSNVSRSCLTSYSVRNFYRRRIIPAIIIVPAAANNVYDLSLVVEHNVIFAYDDCSNIHFRVTCRCTCTINTPTRRSVFRWCFFVVCFIFLGRKRTRKKYSNCSGTFETQTPIITRTVLFASSSRGPFRRISRCAGGENRRVVRC